MEERQWYENPKELADAINFLLKETLIDQSFIM